MKRKRRIRDPWATDGVRREVQYRVQHGLWRHGDGVRLASLFSVSRAFVSNALAEALR